MPKNVQATDGSVETFESQNDLRIQVSGLESLDSGVVPADVLRVSTGLRERHTGNLKVNPAGGMQVQVMDGSALIGGQIHGKSTISPTKAVGTLTLAAADATNPRIDLIVVKGRTKDTSDPDLKIIQGTGQLTASDLEVIAGTPAADPVPAFTDDQLNDRFKVRVASVAVRAGATSVLATDIFQREWQTSVGDLEKKIKNLQDQIDALAADVEETRKQAEVNSDNLKTAVNALPGTPAEVVTFKAKALALVAEYNAVVFGLQPTLLVGDLSALEPGGAFVTPVCVLAAKVIDVEAALDAAIAATTGQTNTDLSTIKTGSFADVKADAEFFKATVAELERLGNIQAEIGSLESRVATLEAQPTVPATVLDDIDDLQDRVALLEAGGAGVTEAVSFARAVNFPADKKGTGTGLQINTGIVSLAPTATPTTLYNQDFTGATANDPTVHDPNILSSGAEINLTELRLKDDFAITTTSNVTGIGGAFHVTTKLSSAQEPNLKLTQVVEGASNPSTRSHSVQYLGTVGFLSSTEDTSILLFPNSVDFHSIRIRKNGVDLVNQQFRVNNSWTTSAFGAVSITPTRIEFTVRTTVGTVELRIVRISDGAIIRALTMNLGSALAQVGSVLDRAIFGSARMISNGLSAPVETGFSAMDDLKVEQTDVSLVAPFTASGDETFTGIPSGKLTDIESVIVKPVEDKPANTAITYDLSLDNGATVLSNVAPNTLVDVSATKPDQVDVKINLSTTDTNVTPKVTALVVEGRTTKTTSQLEAAMSVHEVKDGGAANLVLTLENEPKAGSVVVEEVDTATKAQLVHLEGAGVTLGAAGTKQVTIGPDTTGKKLVVHYRIA